MSRAARTQVQIFMALALTAGVLLPVGRSASAQTGNIEFLNPSSFSTSPETGIIVSDKVPENPDAGDETYRLSAWVSGVPQTPAVEFELLTRQGVSLEVIDDVERVGTDTFEADWDIPDTLPDGPYTLRATLASGVLGIDNADQPIMIQRLAERAEITYPDNRGGTGRYGMYVPLATSTGTDGQVVAPNPVGNIDSRNTGSAPGSGTARVRAFYTVSEPGSQPDWQVCGTEATGGAALPSVAADNGIRCTLLAPEHLSLVSAVAVVANTTKEGYQASLNQAGDATRVTEAYGQLPSKLDVITGETGTVDSGGCHLVEVELTDQFGREVVGANLDVHAWGPTDRLKFGTGPFDAYEAAPPGESPHATEEGSHCFRPEDDRSIGPQAEHQIIGGPDMKHVESLVSGVAAPGTNDEGIWGFELYIPEDVATATRHTSYWEVWLDEANTGSGVNNDVYDTNELCGSGLVGWDTAASGEPMPGPTPACPETPPSPPCGTATQTAQPCPTESPTTSPTDPPDAGGSISIEASRTNVIKGRKVRFSGVVDSTPECSAGREVVLQTRRPGRNFRNRVTTASDAEGSWSVRRKPATTKQWRVFAPAVTGCEGLLSNVVKVKVSRRR